MIIYPKILDVDINADAALFIDDGILSIDTMQRKYNIAYLIEPIEIVGTKIQEYVLNNYTKFDLILTDQTPLLSLPNSELFILGLPWINNNDKSMKPINFGISTIVGRKKYAPGHKLRYELWNRQNEIVTTKFFYTSHLGGPDGKLILGQDKSPLFKTMFHIAIENSQSEYYITEKITDCFRSFVVPIYYGATKISNYFNTRGIITVNSIDEIIDACNNITISTYTDMLPYILENYEISSNYIDLNNRVKEIIKNKLNI